MPDFQAFPKIPRIEKLNQRIIVTEKLDGTNAQVFIDEEGAIHFGSRSRWLTPEKDNYGFCKWGLANAQELLRLGPGHHYGEWYGFGIQRGYGLQGRRFALFNTQHWSDPAVRPTCCEVVSVLYDGASGVDAKELAVWWADRLAEAGSRHVPGFMKPEGVVLFLMGSSQSYKVILDKQGPSPEEAL